MRDVPLPGSEITTPHCGDAIQIAVAVDAFVAVANPRAPGKLEAQPENGQGLSGEQGGRGSVGVEDL